MRYKPKNEIISDIFHRIVCNLPLRDGDYDPRKHLAQEWEVLEKRIKQYYNLKRVKY